MTTNPEARMRRLYDEPTHQHDHAGTEDHPRWIRSRMMAGLDAAIR